MNDRRKALQVIAGCGAAALSPLLAERAMAQTFPSKPVRTTTPFPAGSGPDAALRLVAEHLGKKWGQPVVVDNKPGGGGFIAVSQFKQGVTDGHDLIQLDSNHITTHPHTYKKLPYNVAADFAPLGMILRTPFFVTVAADSPIKTLDDLIAKAREKQDAMFYGSWFVGSPGHIGALRLQSMTGTKMVHVPFRDFGALYAAVSSQEVNWALGSIASAGPLEKAGRLRFIALAAPARDAQHPNVPATSELAFVRGFEVSAWAGLFAPATAPAAVRARVAADIAEVLANPTVAERYRTFGYELPKMSPAAFAELIRQETASWRDVITAANLTLD
ncbi:Bug family tripartite tricarboxylate transporter substrate binding protein [Aquabacterium sp.]|uniref:Bug family tripartite tricarboxylate transporter substrate binding protein n=1 Tax=Aquabacterium sp. TaxID=1872578 RepID=UPI002D0210B9|nr:tripartite tricarboxylate transporter substrate binding protein [Aquabacterium sp.]HSW05177.1 tripartite tricarboxylate transporter substrate binding protein [Aquabacterium sp.]